MGNNTYFKQLLSGKDFAKDNGFADQMKNYCYLIGDSETKEVVAVDPTYDVKSIYDQIAEDDMTLTGVLITHYHGDHIGGEIAGNHIEGAEELLELCDVPIIINKNEKEWVSKSSELLNDNITLKDNGDIVKVGTQEIKLLHTPGHTPGSQCFIFDNKLISGDTLFLEGCGRTDLPGGDPEELYRSLNDVLLKLPDDMTLCPGHNYSNKASQNFGVTKSHNVVFKPKTAQEWMKYFG